MKGLRVKHQGPHEMGQGPGSKSGLDMTQQKGQLHTELARRGASASTGEGVASHAGGPFLPGPTLSPDQRIHMPGQGGCVSAEAIQY